VSDFDDELESMIEGEHSEAAQIVYIDEYGVTPLDEVRLIFDSSSIIVGNNGDAVLSDTPVVLVLLDKIEALIGETLTDAFGFEIRGKTYPVRDVNPKDAHGMARVELRRALD